mgnify:CR=1 FL=1
MLIASDLTVRQGQRVVLRGVSLQAQPGEVTVVVGPSGAGKSTLLAALTSDLPYDGSVTLNDLDIKNANAVELAQLRAVLPQSTPMTFPFTVLEVVRIGQIRSGADDQIAMRALAHVGLSGFAGRFYQELSGGEQQRVQLARVLAQVWEPVQQGVPRWLFLDEPVSSLDIGHQIQVMQIIRDFAQGGGGVVMVMHDLNLTAMCADSLVLLVDGKILCQDKPEVALSDELLSRAYGCEIMVNRIPESGVFLLPQVVRPRGAC